MDISTLQRLHRMGILSTDQAKHFALGGEYGGEEGVDPYQDWMTRNIGTPTDFSNNQQVSQQMFDMQPTHLYGPQGVSQPGVGVLFPPQQSPWEANPSMLSVPPVAAPTTLSVDNSQPSFGSDYEAYLADAKKSQGSYRDAQAVDNAFKSGLITQQERDRLQLLSPEQLKAEKKPLTDDQKIDTNAVNGMDAMRYLNPMGGDFTSNMYQAGRALASEKGTPGRGLGIGLNVGAGLLEAARGIGSGMAYQNMNSQTRNYYDDLMKRRQYTAASQTQNANITGGVAKYGGVFKDQSFALGGEQQPSEEEQMMMQQQGAPQEGEAMPQEGQQNPQEQMVQIAQQLVAGLHSLEAIDAYLKEQKVDQQTYTAIMQIAQKLIEEQGQGENQESTEETPTMRNGGKFKHKVGDKIEFTHKGKKHKGVIKKIENGQIYL